MLPVEIKCPYCGNDELWFEKIDLLDSHIQCCHPQVIYRSIDDQIASWRMIGMYEER